MDDCVDWIITENMETGRQILYFAGEHTVAGSEGWQCPHGRSNSVIHAAYQILTGDISQNPISELCQHLTCLPSILSRNTEHEMLDLKTSILMLKQRLEQIKSKITATPSEILSIETAARNNQAQEKLVQSPSRNNTVIKIR